MAMAVWIAAQRRGEASGSLTIRRTVFKSTNVQIHGIKLSTTNTNLIGEGSWIWIDLNGKRFSSQINNR